MILFFRLSNSRLNKLSLMHLNFDFSWILQLGFIELVTITRYRKKFIIRYENSLNRFPFLQYPPIIYEVAVFHSIAELICHCFLKFE